MTTTPVPTTTANPSNLSSAKGVIEAQIDAVRKDRAKYGNLHVMAGQIMADFADIMLLLLKSGLSYHWVQVLKNMLRLTREPNNRELWIDIHNYAKLALELLEAQPPEKQP